MVLLMNSHGWNDVFYNVVPFYHDDDGPVYSAAGMESPTVETVNAGTDGQNACEIWLGTEYHNDYVAGNWVRLSSPPSERINAEGNHV